MNYLSLELTNVAPAGHTAIAIGWLIFLGIAVALPVGAIVWKTIRNRGARMRAS